MLDVTRLPPKILDKCQDSGRRGGRACRTVPGGDHPSYSGDKSSSGSFLALQGIA